MPGWRLRRLRRNKLGEESAQTLVEYGVLYITVIIPLTFGIMFIAEMLWIWHSVVDFTRDGARYASTHCYQSDSSNVVNYMQANVPLVIDSNQFSQGPAMINVTYYAADPTSGELTVFGCTAGDCSVDCLPDAVTVSISNYAWTRFQSFLGLPPITIPSFQQSLPIESNGCDPELNVCNP